MDSKVILCYQLLLLACVFTTGAFGKGESAAIGDYPYKVAIQSKVNEQFICGGALIRDDIVLTAADCIDIILAGMDRHRLSSCIYAIFMITRELIREIFESVHKPEAALRAAYLNKYDKTRTDVTILAGDVEVLGPVGTFHSQITKLVKPDTFGSGYQPKDNIGLIKLTTPIPEIYKQFASPIELAQTITPINTKCKITNFVNGIFDEDKMLRSYDVDIIHKSVCNNTFTSFNENWDDLICSNNGMNSGNGFYYLSDLGGPIVCDSKIVGIGSVNSMLPMITRDAAAYLDILPYNDWIERNIFEGSLVEDGEHPYLVYLQGHDHLSNDYRKQYCVGVLINSDTVLTTATCSISYSLNPRAVVGVTETPYWTDLGGHTIQRIIKHYEYNNRTNENNIALIKLSSPVSGVVFPDMTVTKDETLCTAVGWGEVPRRHNEFLTKHLLAMNLTQRDRKECSNAYPGKFSDSMLCLGDPERKRNFCENDLGGPLFCGGVLRGIYTLGHSCVAGPEFPSVYLDVDKYRDWIQRGDSWTNKANLTHVIALLILSFYTIM